MQILLLLFFVKFNKLFVFNKVIFIFFNKDHFIILITVVYTLFNKIYPNFQFFFLVVLDFFIRFYFYSSLVTAIFFSNYYNSLF